MSGSELTDASQRRNLDEIEVNLMLMTSCGNIPGFTLARLPRLQMILPLKLVFCAGMLTSPIFRVENMCSIWFFPDV